jgi:hypothetical protein
MKRGALGLTLVLFLAPAGALAQNEQHAGGFYSFAVRNTAHEASR